MKEYTVMTLSYISRLALLEKADRTRGAIDDLVSILRYMEDDGEAISTLSMELKFVEKMFQFNREKKGQAFRYVIKSDLTEDRCYLPKGLLVAVAELAMGKGMDTRREMLEVIVSVAARGGQVAVTVKDNGESNEVMEAVYAKRLDRYHRDLVKVAVTFKRGIGTSVEMVFETQ